MSENTNQFDAAPQSQRQETRGKRAKAKKNAGESSSSSRETKTPRPKPNANREAPASVQGLMDALNTLKSGNSDVLNPTEKPSPQVARLINQVNNLNAQFDALRRNSLVTTTSRGGYGVISTADALAENPPANLAELAERLTSALKGSATCPKFVFQDGGSTVIKADTSRTYTCSNGVGGFTSGHTVVILFERLRSHMGVLVFDVDPTNPSTRNVIASIGYNRAAERITTSLANLMTNLRVASSRVVTGAATTFAPLLYEALTYDGNLCAVKAGSGKMLASPGSVYESGRLGDISEASEYIQHNLLMNASELVRRDNPDPLNSELLTFPNSATASTTKGSVMYGTGDAMVLIFSGNSTNSLRNNGYPTVTYGAGQTFTTGGANYWVYSGNNYYNQVLAMGSFSVDFVCNLLAQTSSHETNVALTVTYDNSDGTSTAVTNTHPHYSTVGSNIAGNFSWDSRGNTEFSAYDGYVQKDFGIKITSTADTTLLYHAAGRNQFVKLTLHDIPSRQQTSGFIIPSVTDGTQLLITATNQTELRPSTATIDSNFVTISEERPADPDAVRAIMLAPWRASPHEATISTSSFLKKMKKVANVAKKVSGVLKHVPGPLGDVAGIAHKGLTTFTRSAIDVASLDASIAPHAAHKLNSILCDLLFEPSPYALVPPEHSPDSRVNMRIYQIVLDLCSGDHASCREYIDMLHDTTCAFTVNSCESDLSNLAYVIGGAISTSDVQATLDITTPHSSFRYEEDAGVTARPCIIAAPEEVPHDAFASLRSSRVCITHQLSCPHECVEQQPCTHNAMTPSDIYTCQDSCEHRMRFGAREVVFKRPVHYVSAGGQLFKISDCFAAAVKLIGEDMHSIASATPDGPRSNNTVTMRFRGHSITSHGETKFAAETIATYELYEKVTGHFLGGPEWAKVKGIEVVHKTDVNQPLRKNKSRFVSLFLSEGKSYTIATADPSISRFICAIAVALLVAKAQIRTGYGTSAPKPHKATSFNVIGVVTAADQAFAVELPVLKGDHLPFYDAVVGALPNCDVGLGTNVVGRSNSLGCFLAYLSTVRGFPVIPGLYSGQVDNIVLYPTENGGVAATTFTINAVGDEEFKVLGALNMGSRLNAVFPDTVYQDGVKRSALEPRLLFPINKVQATATQNGSGGWNVTAKLI